MSREINALRLNATGELATWDAYDFNRGGVRIRIYGNEGDVEVTVSNRGSSMGEVITAEEAESLRQWLNTRHEEAKP